MRPGIRSATAQRERGTDNEKCEANSFAAGLRLRPGDGLGPDCLPGDRRSQCDAGSDQVQRRAQGPCHDRRGARLRQGSRDRELERVLHGLGHRYRRHPWREDPACRDHLGQSCRRLPGQQDRYRLWPQSKSEARPRRRLSQRADLHRRLGHRLQEGLREKDLGRVERSVGAHRRPEGRHDAGRRRGHDA